MMRYRRKQNNKKIIISLSVMLLLILLTLFNRSREALEEVASPLVAISASASSAYSNLSNETKSRDELIKEINTLKEENTRLSLENLNQEFLKEQNKRLKELLGSEAEEGTLALARVLAKPPVTPFDSLTIEVNKSTNIEKGQKIRVTENDEIGIISSSSRNTAIAKLYTSPGTQTPVEINGNGVLVIAEGIGGGAYELHIPRSFEVKRGDLLTKPGLENVIIGVIEEVEKSDADSFSLVRARLPINLYEVTWVYVKKSS